MSGFWVNISSSNLTWLKTFMTTKEVINFPHLTPPTPGTVKEIKNGKIRIISFFAKKARGMMARYIIDNQIVNSEDIYNFDLAGYKYDESLSSIQKPVFTRAQP